MLKTTGLSGLSAPKVFRAKNIKVVGGGSRADKMVVNLFKKLKNKKSKISMYSGAAKEPIFLTPNAKKAFNHLKQVSIKAPILQHFDPECHIRIEIDKSDYSIDKLLS